MKNYYLQMIENTNEFLSLQNSWKQLHQRAIFPTIFNSWEWVYSCILSFEYKKICIIVLWEDPSQIKTPLLIIPLSIHRKGSLTYANIIGYETSDYNNFLIDREIKSINLFYDAIKEAMKKYNIAKCIISQIPNDYYCDYIFTEKHLFNGLMIKRNIGASTYYSELLDDPRKKLSGKRLKKINNRLQRIENIDGKIVVLDNISVEIMTEFFKLHIKKWGSESIFIHNKYKNFMFNICKLMKHQIVFHVIFCDNKDISYSISFKDSERLYGYITTYDELFSCFSPGTILQYKEYLFAIKEGLRYFDLLRGAESYKQTWADEELKTSRISIYLLSPAGCFKCLSDAIYKIFKTLKQLMSSLINRKNSTSNFDAAE